MKRIDGWLTLSFSGLCLLFLTVSLFFYMQNAVHPLPLIAAAVCWGFGFSWFVRLGRLARGKARRLYGTAFGMLCACLLFCLILCVLLAFFRG